MQRIIPEKLKKGDEIRVIAPSRSLSIVWESNYHEAFAYLENKGFKITFGKRCRNVEYADSASIQDRVDDLHEAFLDDQVKAILTSIGGFNVNQILEYLDFSLIQNHPKIICGYSDITALLCAIEAKTGLVTYHGPHFSSFGMTQNRAYTYKYFEKCVMSKQPFQVESFLEKGNLVALQEGKASGRIVGGNLCTLNLLQGTRFMPSLDEVILFIEDDNIMGKYFEDEFERNLQSLFQVTHANIKGIVFGRLDEQSQLDVNRLKQIIAHKKQCQSIPLIANADFGHIFPFFTFPIGGFVTIEVKDENCIICINEH